MAAAPFFADLADGPPGGRALWLHTADQIRIRIGFWGGGAKGTVVLLPGRTEYIEKYGRTARELLRRGWSVLCLDWRGQGLSDRLLPDPCLGHIGHFDDYQRDLDAALAWLEAEGAAQALTGPRMLLSHSMGGLIALRALQRGLSFGAAVFSAPMWGIRIPLWRQPLAGFLQRLPLALPQDRFYAPTTSAKSYLLSTGFEANHLTGCQESWGWLQAQVTAEPELQLGGPSLGWLRAALRESQSRMRIAAPDLPVLTVLGSREHIVRPAPVRRYMASWPGGRLEIYEGARHEVLMEQSEHRQRFFDSAVRLFEENAAKALRPAASDGRSPAV